MERRIRWALKEWAARILYIDSCKQVGASPNWAVFEAKSAEEQSEAAALASAIASNYNEYRQLCGKLELQPDSHFVDLAIGGQQDQNTLLKERLWEEKKETIKKVAIGAAVVVAVVVAAVITKKAIDSWNGPSKAVEESIDEGGNVPPIDRSDFANKRSSFWKAEAESNPGRYGESPENLARMKAGKAPIGDDGFSMELHHLEGTPDSKLVPMTRTDHRLGDNFRLNHPWLFEKKE